MTDLQILPASLDLVTQADDALKRYKQLRQITRRAMVEDVDYGHIPGTAGNKPTLLKPGAEKLAQWYGLGVEVPDARLRWVIDHERGYISITAAVLLRHRRSGSVVAEGIGEANSLESKYRSRDAYSLSNTLLKMAKKRALVDAVLTGTAASGLFTQDLDERDEEEIAGEVTEMIEAKARRRSSDHAPAIPQRVIDRYVGLTVTAEQLGLDHAPYDAAWPLAEITARGLDLKARISEKQTEPPQ